MNASFYSQNEIGVPPEKMMGYIDDRHEGPPDTDKGKKNVLLPELPLYNGYQGKSPPHDY